MDLGGYAQIKDYEGYLKGNNIEIPRLRGIRLMSEEEIITKSEIDDIKKASEIEVCKTLCESEPFFSLNPMFIVGSEETRRKCRKHMEQHKVFYDDSDPTKFYKEFFKIRWDIIHGWKRKSLKYAIKIKKREVERQFSTFNKYVGRFDVLNVHCKLGYTSWSGGYQHLVKEPWFLEAVDDWWDTCYCDIYVQFDPSKYKEITTED